MPDASGKKTIQRLTSLEQELLETNANYRDMVEQAWDGIVIHDSRAIYFANRSCRQMFGLTPDQPLDGVHLHRFLAPDTRRSLFEALKTAERTPEAPVFFEGHGIRADGSFYDLEISTYSTTYKGQPALQTIFRDISQRKQMEKRLLHSERLAATGKLAFNIAHEINNPLGGIVTYTHLLMEDLAEGSTPDQLTELVEKILKLAHRCQVIVSALLDFARDEREILEAVNLNTVVEETLYLLQGHIILIGLDLEKNLSVIPPIVRADRTKIEQVLMNLTINAAEAMDGRGRLRISTWVDQENRTVYFAISDTGPGILEEHKKLLFEPFFSTKPRGRGTGLGLAISHGIIKQHKGEIVVDSIPGQGTTFTIRLPAI